MYLPSYLTNFEKEKVYENTSIGINMHLSSPARETGNARTYELAYRGVAQVIDTSNASLIKKIFEPNKEILTYESIDECIFQTKRLMEDDDLRCKIALAGYKKATEEYSYKKTLERLINWFKSQII
jgi:spore maturation protein CgeB